MANKANEESALPSALADDVINSHWCTLGSSVFKEEHSQMEFGVVLELVTQEEKISTLGAFHELQSPDSAKAELACPG